MKPAGSPKTGGRQRGTLNKNRQALLDRAKELGVDPFDVLCHFAAGNEKALGYEGPQIKILKDGGTIEEPWINPELRFQAVKEVASYCIAKVRSIELTTDEENPIELNLNLTPDQTLELIAKARGN